jgi:deoxyribonuclease V
MGVVLDIPAIGVAKSLLCGRPRDSVDERPEGWRTPIEAADGVEPRDVDDDAGFSGTVVGYAYQSRQYPNSKQINPLYVSPGHRVSAATTADLVERLGGDYKLPEPTRLADAYADDCKREY